MPDKPKDSLFYRFVEVDSRAVGEDGRIAYAFSSETPVSRWFGEEILSHLPEHIESGRVSALLFNHNPDRIVGAVSKEEFSGGIGRAEAVLDDTSEGALARKRVQSGSLRGISVGYLVKRFRKLEEGEEWTLANGKTIVGGDDRNPTYIATKWAPLEHSLTPIPADPTVGVGRADSRCMKGIECTDKDGNSLDWERLLSGRSLDHTDDPIKPETPEQEAILPPEKRDGGTEMDEKKYTEKDLSDALAKREKELGDEHRKGLEAIHNRASAVGQGALALRLIVEGKSVTEITDEIFKAVAEERGKPGGGGENGDGRETTATIDTVSDEALVRAFTSPAAVTLESE